jgi:hypothetical protein
MELVRNACEVCELLIVVCELLIAMHQVAQAYGWT